MGFGGDGQHSASAVRISTGRHNLGDPPLFAKQGVRVQTRTLAGGRREEFLVDLLEQRLLRRVDAHSGGIHAALASSCPGRPSAPPRPSRNSCLIERGNSAPTTNNTPSAKERTRSSGPRLPGSERTRRFRPHRPARSLRPPVPPGSGATDNFLAGTGAGRGAVGVAFSCPCAESHPAPPMVGRTDPGAFTRRGANSLLAAPFNEATSDGGSGESPMHTARAP